MTTDSFLANEAFTYLKYFFLLALLSCMSCIVEKKYKRVLLLWLEKKRIFFQVEKKKFLSKYSNV